MPKLKYFTIRIPYGLSRRTAPLTLPVENYLYYPHADGQVTRYRWVVGRWESDA